VGSDAGNMSFIIWEAKALRDRGIHVVTFDYRGFGESSDFAVNHNHLFYHEFAVDLDLVIKDVRARYPENKIGLLALSMGTYVSLLRKEHIDFMVGDGFYFDPHAVISRIRLAHGKETIVPAHAPRIEKINPAVPVLIFCTTQDKITVKTDAVAFSALNQVTIIESEGDHLSSMKNFTRDEPGDVYAERIVEFLDSHKL
jgi:alpha-beta hydrolase superfamily lysophospholipase